MGCRVIVVPGGVYAHVGWVSAACLLGSVEDLTDQALCAAE